jgi:CheY-like chemotaxis protein
MAKAIVIIDDDKDDIDFLKDAINAVDRAAACFDYNDPVKVIDHLMDNNLVVLPTHFFLDFNMPKMTGDKCLQKIKQNAAFNKSIVTMLSTGMPAEDSERFKKMGADFTFAKPATVSGYQKIVEHIFQTLPNR